jgi:glycosyltransferase involved in cell wall biosynthesis
VKSPIRVLALLPAPPGALCHGTSLRAFQLLRRLGVGFQITVAHQTPLDFAACPNQVEVPWPTIALESSSRRLPLGPLRWRQTLGLGEPYAYSEQAALQLRDLSAEQRFDVVLAYHPAMLRYAAALPGLAVVADLVDDPTCALWSELRLTRSAVHALRLLKHLAEQFHYQRSLCPRAWCCFLASETEVNRFRRLIPRARVAALPNGVDLGTLRPSGQPPEPSRLLFTGNFRSRPNLDAVRHFHREVFPAIVRARPEVQWELAGVNAELVDRAIGSDPRTTISGSVPDLRPLFDRAAVVVSPAVSGGGIKNKVLEAWAMRKAVVATPLGAAGLRARDGENLLIARTPAAFAALVVDLLRQPARAEQLGAAGRRTAERHYNWQPRAAQLAASLEQAAASRRGQSARADSVNAR